LAEENTMKNHDLELIADTEMPVAAVAAQGRLLATSFLLTDVLKAVKDGLAEKRFSPLGMRTGTSRASEKKGS
jgi:hypothetical protein